MPCGAHQGKPTWGGGAEPWKQGRGPGKRIRGAQALSSGTMALGDPLMSQKRHTAPEVMPGLPAGARSSPPRWAAALPEHLPCTGPERGLAAPEATPQAPHGAEEQARPGLGRGPPTTAPWTRLDQVGPGGPPARAARPSGWPSTRTGTTPTPRPQLPWGRCRYLLLVVVTLLAAGRRGVVVEDGPGQVVDDGQLPLQGVLDD